LGRDKGNIRKAVMRLVRDGLVGKKESPIIFMSYRGGFRQLSNFYYITEKGCKVLGVDPTEGVNEPDVEPKMIPLGEFMRWGVQAYEREVASDEEYRAHLEGLRRLREAMKG